MKKTIIIILTLLITGIAFYFELTFSSKQSPKTYYNVYLDGELIGTIKSKEELENYIDKQNEAYKKEYNASTVYAPNGLDIKADVIYSNKINKVEEIYNIIQEKKPFTIKGYQYTITSSYTNSEETYNETEEYSENTQEETEPQEANKIKIYVLNKNIFTDSIETFIQTYAGEEAYEMFKNKTQKPIDTTGSIIEDVYLKNNITVKETSIPVTEKIYKNKEELSKFFLFGPEEVKSEYTVKDGDNIETVSFDNRISTQEFLLSNPSFTNVNNLLFPGQVVTIGITNPQIQVVVKQYVVEDVESAYSTEITYDSTRVKGDNAVIRQGENGLNRVSKELEVTNGIITSTTPKGIEELKPAISRIMVYGQKIIPSRGTGAWSWPTNQGYTISSQYGWRVDPINGSRSLHTGLDISGTGYGSPVYAADNGVVIRANYYGSYGNCIIINHNNGYYTLYAHLAKFNTSVDNTVAKGQIIGFVGSSGRSTGAHLHYEAWYGGPPYQGGTRFNPWDLYR